MKSTAMLEEEIKQLNEVNQLWKDRWYKVFNENTNLNQVNMRLERLLNDQGEQMKQANAIVAKLVDEVTALREGKNPPPTFITETVGMTRQ